MSSQKEPYLDDLRIVFQPTFILTDPTMNTAEVQYFHCRIPKTRLIDTKINQVEPSIAPLTNENYKQKAKNVESSSIQPSNVIKEKLEQPPAETPPQSPVQPAEMQTPSQESPNQKQNLSPQPRKRIQQLLKNQNVQEQSQDQEQDNEPAPKSPPPRNKISRSSGYNFEETDSPLSMSEYWTIPLKSQENVRFIFYKNENELGFVNPSTKQIQIKGIISSNHVSVMLGGQRVAEIRQQDDNTFYIYNCEEKPYFEYCAMKLNQSFVSEGGPLLFELYIPALKKRPECQRYVSIEASETSGLIARVEQKAKEAIVMKTRMPQNTGNSFDLSFENIFKKPDFHNFIIYHDSNPKRIVSTLGLLDGGLYRATVTYPMCPLQSFFACCGSFITQK